MNIVKETFNGQHIKVKYNCGHIEMELSRSASETNYRKRMALATVCHVCATNKQLVAQRQPTRITADPVSIQLAARRKAAMDMLTMKMNSLRTR